MFRLSCVLSVAASISVSICRRVFDQPAASPGGESSVPDRSAARVELLACVWLQSGGTASERATGPSEPQPRLPAAAATANGARRPIDTTGMEEQPASTWTSMESIRMLLARLAASSAPGVPPAAARPCIPPRLDRRREGSVGGGGNRASAHAHGMQLGSTCLSGVAMLELHRSAALHRMTTDPIVPASSRRRFQNAEFASSACPGADFCHVSRTHSSPWLRRKITRTRSVVGSSRSDRERPQTRGTLDVQDEFAGCACIWSAC